MPTFRQCMVVGMAHWCLASWFSDLLWTSEHQKFWTNATIEVNGRNMSGIFPLKNLQISQRSRHIFRKLVYSLTMLCVVICYQFIFKCNWARNQRKLQFCLTTPIIHQSEFLTVWKNWFQPVGTGFLNQLFLTHLILLLKIPLKSVISDMLQAVSIIEWTLVRIYWSYFSFCHF